jgi:hypothetical protein
VPPSLEVERDIVDVDVFHGTSNPLHRNWSELIGTVLE